HPGQGATVTPKFLHDNAASRLVDGRIAAPRQFGEERRLAATRAAGNHHEAVHEICLAWEPKKAGGLTPTGTSRRMPWNAMSDARPRRNSAMARKGYPISTRSFPFSRRRSSSVMAKSFHAARKWNGARPRSRRLKSGRNARRRARPFGELHRFKADLE